MAKSQKGKKSKKNKTLRAPAAVALAAALPADVQVIEIPAGATLEVDVDVNDMSIPYTVAYDGDVLIKSLVDRRKAIDPLTPGKHRLGWAFAHTLKEWKHKLTLRVNGAPTVLEEKSEAAKDPDHSVGVAFIVVN